MDQPHNIYHSFLIRLWREERAGEPGESSTWLGEILHIQTGQKWPLDNLGEVQAALKAAMEDP